MELCFKKTALDHMTTKFVLRGITHTKNGTKLRQSGHLSYTRVWELMNQKLSSLGYNAADFGMHSFGTGGATAAANTGVPDQLFKRHGRWRSDSAKDWYIKHSLHSRFSVLHGLQL